ncbi:hypothetical protein ASPWEDRAFT_32297 [Aspergillus wentii DTO 134E9]|uniref:N-acetyltransferase domain-containing protein n=1 Tax=Aspergillus wentii DTO 134E9 TaxID=1073089 RepID=A0A1L9R570_ASPWE|nr:uncharacterized protein ASPWEDRAFT_32297 [Aspergillus wentii DTO 134E9]KAI9923713.1 hypothetical protein MW887_008340 [Aspergillus wentii]OJJ30066.1 hypothetical protein ASPWEDRAFT_32297 [Aspergillus wentii DTO 134E9]
MSLSIVPMTKSDIPRCIEIENLAYADNPLNRVLFPSSDSAGFRSIRENEMEKAFDEESISQFFKVVDSELSGDDATIAWAKWQICPEGFPERPPRQMDVPGMDIDVAKLILGGQDSLINRVITGKPCIYLSNLQTEPKHQRRGAAAMLVRLLLEAGKDADLPVFLVSSRAGYIVYQKNGFVDFEVVETDLRRFGQTEPHVMTVMRWEAPVDSLG